MAEGRQLVLAELQMLTGTVTDDMDYLIYLVLKDGTFFDKPASVAEDAKTGTQSVVEDLEGWFREIQ